MSHAKSKGVIDILVVRYVSIDLEIRNRKEYVEYARDYAIIEVKYAKIVETTRISVDIILE